MRSNKFLNSKIVVLLVLLVFGLSPFLYGLLVSELRLLELSQDISKIDTLLPDSAIEVASGSQVMVGGNGELCSYRVMVVYKLFQSVEKTEEIGKRVLSQLSKKTNDFKNTEYAKFNVFNSYSYLTIVGEYGPFSAGFDFRCW